MEQLQDLRRIPTLVWGELRRAVQQTRHSWRTPVLANTTAHGVRLRTVVLRQSDSTRRALRFYTDQRAAKWLAVEQEALFTIHFYDPKRKWQLLAKGRSVALDKETSDQIWRNLPVHSRAAYASQLTPGTPITTGTDGLPANFFDLNLAATEYARANFGTFELVLQSLEVLQLHREGHRRASFVWNEESAVWEGQWLVP